MESRYRIIRELGSGSMGQVFLVEHRELGREEALKVLKPGFAVDPKFVSRFRREARAANRVQHPNIVSVYDFGRLPDGRVFLSMEYAKGPPIDRLLREQGPFSVQRTAHVIGQLAAAVDHAHACGVIHRDLKPHNLILTEHRGEMDVLKVLDFGIAKIVCPEYSESVILTCDGDIFGTPAYVAPEMVKALPPDPRSDIYAIGCVAYELLVGQPPFEGGRIAQWHAHVNDTPVPPSQRRRDIRIPSLLDTVVMTCLQKDPDKRFQTGSGVLTVLRQVASDGRMAGGFLRDTRVDLGRVPGVASTGAGTFPEEALAVAETAYASTEELHANLRAVLLELGEGCRALGVASHQLAVLLAEMRRLDGELADCQLEQAALRGREARVEQEAREREAKLRFAIGELDFDRDSQPPAPGVDLDAQIAALSARLREVAGNSRAELDRLEASAIELATTRHQLEERRRGTLDRLRQLIDGLLPRLTDPAMVAARKRYHTLSDLLARAEQGQ